MRKGTTSTGFAYEFDETTLDDMRFVDVLAVVVDEKSSPLDKVVGASKLLTLMLGEEQKEKLLKLNVEYIQGFLYSRPVSGKELIEVMKKQG